MRTTWIVLLPVFCVLLELISALPVEAQLIPRRMRQRSITDLSCYYAFDSPPAMRWREVEARARDLNIYALDPEADPGDLLQNEFERFSITRSFGLAKYEGKGIESPEREAITKTLKRVEPDAVDDLIEIGNSPIPIPYPESVFYDSKGGTSPINPRLGKHQITGFIDALQRSSAGVAGHIPRLYFLTPADKRVQPATLNRATLSGVAVFQSITCDVRPVGGRLGIDDMVMGKSVLLNPEVLLQSNVRYVDIDAIGHISIYNRSTLGPLFDDPEGDDSIAYGPERPPGLCFISTEETYEYCGSSFSARLSARDPLDQKFSDRTSEVTAVPEPASTLAVLAVGVWGGVSWRKHKREKELATGNVM